MSNPKRAPHPVVEGQAIAWRAIEVRRGEVWRASLGLIVLAAVAWLVVVRMQPPDVVPADAPPDTFSAERARVHLERIARAPHPSGSEANRQVEVYIAGVLSELGLSVDRQASPACAEAAGLHRCAHVRNVIATWPGQSHEDAILLSAHYDSVPNAPGAGDDGAAVAALLEVARVLAQGGPLARDVMFAFVDAEEELLLGAAGLCASNDLSRIRLVANFDARGSRGPVTLIGASPGSGEAIDVLSGALTAPVLSSFYPSVARVLPNATDAEVYERCGLRTLSFAFADGFEQYHQGTDSPSRLDLRSLQHHGSHALDIARRFATGDRFALARDGGELIFFDVARLWVVRYSPAFARLFALALALGTAWVVTREARSARQRRRSLLLAPVAFAGSLLGAALIGVGVVTAVTHGWRFWTGYVHAGALAGCAACPVLAAGLALLGGLERRRRETVTAATVTSPTRLGAEADGADAEGANADRGLGGPAIEVRRGADARVALGPLLVWVSLAALSAALVPGVSHLFMWPAAGLLAARVWRPRSALVGSLGATLLRIPTVLLLTPVMYTLVVVIGAPGVGGVMLCFGLVLGACAEPLWLIAGRVRHAGKALLALGVVLGLALHVRGRNELGPPVGNAVSYAVDAMAKRAYWVSADASSDAYTRQFLGERPELGRPPAFASDGPLLMQQAPFAELPAPKLELVSDGWSEGERSIVLRLSSPRGARSLRLWEEGGVPFEHFRFDERQPVSIVRFSPELDVTLFRLLSGLDGQGRWSIMLFALPPDGSLLTLSTQHEGALELRAFDRSEGLAARPVGLTPRGPEWTEGYPGDSTWVSAAPLHLGARPRPTR
jgi:peptidase M28-like protein